MKTAPDGHDSVGKWKFPQRKFCYDKTILIKNTNMIGNTYFSNYIEWQGEAREKLLLEHPGTKIFLQRNPHILLSTYCVYHRFTQSTYFGDRIRIEMTSRDIQKSSAVLSFQYVNLADEKLVGEGWQKIVFSDAMTKRLCDIPQLFLDLLEPILETGSKA